MSKNISRIKIVFIGEPAVGKTAIVKKYTMNTFSDKYMATISMDFFAKDVDGILLDLWDLSGHPEFFEERGKYYEGTQILVLVFDITSRRTFDSLDMWLNESNVFNEEKPIVLLCGNKTDLNNLRAVPKNEAEYWALVRNIEYFEVSAHDRDNIDEFFNACIAKCNPPEEI